MSSSELVRRHERFHSALLPHDRTIVVALPTHYAVDPNARYAVLYMHDGQNLFDPTTSFIPGHTWAADSTARALAARRAVEPLIMVGIYNTGEHRIDEYTPTSDSRIRRGGQSIAYGRMIVEELKPAIDSAYRTRTDAESTGLCGSSLGGLATLDIGLRYPDVFGKLGAMSPSVWWDNKYIVRSVEALPQKNGQRIYVDMGTREGRGLTEATRTLRDAFLSKGWRLDADLVYQEARNARHTELAWARRVGPMLRFLFPLRKKRWNRDHHR